MTDKQWQQLLNLVNGKGSQEVLSGFIIDSPWLPNWHNISILDYFSNDELWLEANLNALNTFPNTLFLPGFWSEYGMCTEPSAFGAKTIFWENEFPFAEKVILKDEDIDALKKPNPATDGLLPFMLNRLKKAQPKIEEAGHKIRFSVSRGPLNIASFLMGTTELMMAMMLSPERVHQLMRIITDFLKEWHQIQHSAFSSIEGIMMLDDILGFIGEQEFVTFGLPYFKELYDTNDKVKLFHNDGGCKSSIKYYSEIGINLYNPGTDMTINELHEATDHKITILGSIPPRDVLAAKTPLEVYEQTRRMMDEVKDKSQLLASCAGGMPPDVSTQNLQAFIKAIHGEDF